jgi:aldehyde dehydrogenase (NAD+)
MTPSDRRNLILKLADEIEKNRDELAHLESLDNGKPFNFIWGEMSLTIDVFRYYAGWTDKILGSTIPMNGPF